MSLSVEDVLSLEVFSRIDHSVFAGEQNLHRFVRWVHPTEIPDIARFLRGGEMLLTAGLGIGTQPKDQQDYLRALHSAGAAVLVIELSGRAFSEMPKALVDEAEMLRFPLIGLDGELSFAEVSAQVREGLADQEMQDLLAYQKLNNSIMELLVSGQDHVPIIQALSEVIEAPVILEESSRRILAYFGGSSTSDRVVSNWDQHSRVLHRHDTDSGISLADVSASSDSREACVCTRRPVVIHGERWGWLHIIHSSGELMNVTDRAVDRTLDAIAISVLSRRETHARTAQHENSLLSRLMLGDIEGDRFIARALQLGKDLRNKSLLAICSGQKDTTVDDTQEVLLRACEELSMPAITAEAGGHAMAIVGLPDETFEDTLVVHLLKRGLSAGVSRQSGPVDLHAAIRQARNAASVAFSRSSISVVRFDELGVLRLLVSLAQGPELANYVEDELGPILRHDAKSSHPLLPTLRAYVESGGNKSRTAEHLYIQRRTLYYRLQRLDSLLRRSLDEDEVRQNLSFALRGMDLLQTSTAQSVHHDP